MILISNFIKQYLKVIPAMIKDYQVNTISWNNKEITIIGTAHVSKESVALVDEVIKEINPDTVCVELCHSRLSTISDPSKWKNTNLIDVIKKKQTAVLMSNLILASYQKRMGEKLGVAPGEEIRTAVKVAKEIDAAIVPVDREIKTTLKRAWHSMGFWSAIKFIGSLLYSMFDSEEITEEEIEKLKNKDILESVLVDMKHEMPAVSKIIIHERDLYLTESIRNAPGNRIVAVVGAGHVPGILKEWENADIDIKELSTLPPKSKFTAFFKWLMPAIVVCLILAGFYFSGADAGKEMILYWIAANSTLAGIGSALALSHPLTIISAAIAAPITSLNPMIAAGWVAGLVEVFLRKPKVDDFDKLFGDITSVRGFWKNKITRILLVVLFTNIGSSIGTFLALPLMGKAL